VVGIGEAQGVSGDAENEYTHGNETEHGEDAQEHG